jgi:hypothetical protein
MNLLCVGTLTTALDPTFGGFTLLEPVSHSVNRVCLVKVFRQFRLEQIILVFREWTQYVDVKHLIYWQGQLVCDALLYLDSSMLISFFIRILLATEVAMAI